MVQLQLGGTLADIFKTWQSHPSIQPTNGTKQNVGTFLTYLHEVY